MDFLMGIATLILIGWLFIWVINMMANSAAKIATALIAAAIEEAHKDEESESDDSKIK